MMEQITTNNSDCFSDDEWAFFERQLESSRAVCRELAKKMHFYEIIDSRWPSTGIQSKKWFRQWQIRITLNPQYLNDSEEDYEKLFYVLSLHSFFCIPFFSYSASQSYRALKKYSVEEIQDKNLIQVDMQQQIKLLRKSAL